MIVAYILKKSRMNKIKMVFREGQRFNYKGLDYDISDEAIYLKKFLGIKLFRYSQYMEGLRDPLIFDFKAGGLTRRQTHIDNVAQLISKLKFLKMELIMLILLVFILIVGLVTYAQVSGAIQNL